jgi:hypothetical protein
MTRNEHIVIRSASSEDEQDLAVLGVLDGGTRQPQGHILVAEVGGRLRAAVGSNGAAISDPFWPSAELVSMLRMRSEGVVSTDRQRRFARRPALRVAEGI